MLALLVKKSLRKLRLPTQLGLDCLFRDLSPIIIVFVDAGLGRIAGLLTLESENGGAPTEVLQRVGSNLAMHVVAARLLFLPKDHVAAKTLEAERDILKTKVPCFGT